jgi:hypothetical protein
MDGFVAVASCVVVLHSPNGAQLIIPSGEDIKVMRPVGEAAQEHVAEGTHSVIYLGVRPNGFGVKESVEQIEAMIEACNDK